MSVVPVVEERRIGSGDLLADRDKGTQFRRLGINIRKPRIQP